MAYLFAFRPYRRSFRSPLQTSHGTWGVREGILLRLVGPDDRVGYGEIAPLPWFGSETLEAALDFCQHCPPQIAPEHLGAIPDRLPACQFGFESAWADLESEGNPEEPPLPHCALLPTGATALHHWQSLWAQGYRTFKWKIGVAPLGEELAQFRQLVTALPTGAKLRLDANGGLDRSQAETWLEACESCPIEFLEQPLSIDQLDSMVELSQHYPTPLALDESVATLAQLEACHDRGWRGLFVVKPAIVGSPSRLRQFCQRHQPDLVFSSVFETAIGRRTALQLAADLSPDRAVGFGTDHWLEPAPPLSEDLWILPSPC